MMQKSKKNAPKMWQILCRILPSLEMASLISNFRMKLLKNKPSLEAEKTNKQTNNSWGGWSDITVD